MRTVLLMLLASGCEQSVHAHSRSEESLPDVAEQVVKGVVSVHTAMSSRHGGRIVQGMGSGSVIDASGIILTNYHVIKGAEQLRVTLHNDKSYAATVVGADPRSDVAVLRLVDPPNDLTVLPWGDSDALRLGETVMAVGSPFGMGHTLTRGIVSAKGRVSVGMTEYENYIQTDAAINPGNSGGALVNTHGALVGVPTMILSRSGGNQGIGLAIPSNMARVLAEDIIEDGVVDRGWLAVAIAPQPNGVLLTGVRTGGAAQRAGLRPRDVIVRFNGEAVSSIESFRASVALTGAGEPFDAVVLRSGREVAVRGLLGRRPDDP